MRSVLLDTNLLLLLVVGLYDRDFISKHKRTTSFLPEDFDLLVECIDRYEVLWVTSHCLAEASNLLRQTTEVHAEGLMECFSSLVADARESRIPKEVIFKNRVFPRMGVADTGLAVKSKRVSCVFTVDFDLYREIANRGHAVVNFNHLRGERYLA
jgi:hypothetical protein